MIMAEVASIRKVRGKRRAMDPEGPIPGRTPTAVPIRTPPRQARNFDGSKRMEKPCKIPLVRSKPGIPYMAKIDSIVLKYPSGRE
jgi:hypothetical protein